MKKLIFLVLFIGTTLISCKKDLVQLQQKSNNCFPDLTLAGITYRLDTCSITVSISKGHGEIKIFERSIVPSAERIYGFTIPSAQGVPGIVTDIGSGGATGKQKIRIYFNDQAFVATPKGEYVGYITIHIYYLPNGGSEPSDSNYLKLKIKLNLN